VLCFVRAMDCLVLCVYGGGMGFFCVWGFLIEDLAWGFWSGIWLGAFIISDLMISFMFEFTAVCKARRSRSHVSFQGTY
jgi:hypothetical protein